MKKGFCTLITALLCLMGFVLAPCASATMGLTSLNGTYKIAELSNSLYQPMGSSVRSIVGGGTIIATFNGSGGCTITSSKKSFEEAFSQNPISPLYDQINTNTDTGSPPSCTYTVSPDGALSLTIDGSEVVDGWHVTPDSSIALKSDVYSEPTGGGNNYISRMLVGIKLGSTMSLSSLNGSYKIGELDATLYVPNGSSVRSDVGGNDIRVSFNGAGTCSASDSWKEYIEGFAPGSSSTLYDQVTSSGAPFASSSCTYSVASDGAMTLTINGTTITGWHVSVDGNKILKSDVAEEPTDGNSGTMYSAKILFGIRLGSAMSTTSLNGTYKIGELNATLFKPNSAPVKSIVAGSDITVSFNGSGSCTPSSIWKEFDEVWAHGSASQLYDQVALYTDPPSTPTCTYEVLSDGATTITLNGTQVIGGWHISADGTSLLRSDVSEKPSGNGTSYTAQLQVGTKLPTPLTGTASGTYDFTPGNPGTLVIHWTSAGFPCSGPSVGDETQSVTSLTATTMTWIDGNNQMSWTRASGTAGNILGTWTTTESNTNNTYSVTFNEDKTISVTGSINQCNNSGIQIKSFNPSGGFTGSQVIIYGENFSSNPATNLVWFNGVPAIVNAASYSQLTVQVPTWASTGKISVSNPAGIASSFSDFTVGAAPGTASGTYTYNAGALALNWISSTFVCEGPLIGLNSETVTTLNETTMVWANNNGGMTWTRSPAGTAGSILGTWTSTDVSSGNTYSATFNSDNSVSVSGTIYQCSGPPAPSVLISGFSPGGGPVGSLVVINGSNFDLTPANNTVKINGTTATVKAASTSQLTVQVPTSATTGRISVSTPTGMAISNADFIVAPANGTASGTYTYATGNLSLNWANSTFICDGPTVGPTSETVASLNATTMVWTYAEGGSMTWIRSQAGTAGNIVGTWTSTDSSSGNSYSLTFNSDNSVSASGTIIQCAGSGDNQAPSVPGGVTATAVSPTQINVNWNQSTDNVGVTYYQVYRNGAPVGTPPGQNNTYWPDTSVTANTTYTYTVAACDGSGNCSAQSAPAQATTPGTTVSMLYGGVFHLTNNDSGQPTDTIQIGIDKVGSSLGSMVATVTGPNGYSYQFTDADIRPYLGGKIEVYKEVTTLAPGVYVFTLNDGQGHISNRVDNHANPVSLPIVDSTTIQSLRKSDGSYRFTWAPVNDSKTYYYRLKISLADTANTPVYLGDRKMDAYEDVPAGTLVDGTAYVIRVQMADAPDFNLLLNQSNSSTVSFTPQSSDYNASRLMFDYASANNVNGGSPTFAFRICTSTKVCTSTESAAVTSAVLTGPASFNNNTGTYTFQAADLVAPNNVDFSKKFTTAPTGTYQFHVVANGIDHYAHATLTAPVSYPTPDSSKYQAEDLGNGNIRFSWADADYNGALYYRVYINDPTDTTPYLASARTNQTFADIAKNSIGDLPSKHWRVEIYDSSSPNTQRNRVNGGWSTTGVLASLPAFDSSKPVISQFRFRKLIYPGGTATDIAANTTCIPNTTCTTVPLSAVNVSGPADYSRNLMAQGQLSSGTYTLTESGAPAPGLYTLTVSDNSQTPKTTIRYNQQPTPVNLQLVDFRTFHVGLEANGNIRFSWAPVISDIPLWYSLEILNANDLSAGPAVRNTQQASVTLTPAQLPQGPLIFSVRAGDGSGFSTTNNISQSVMVGYQVGLDYSTLTDTDNDGFASNVDSNDNDPSVNPSNTVARYSIGGRVTDTGTTSLTGVMVSLFNSNNLQFLGSMATDSTGNYAFGNLTSGSYKVQFIPPGPYDSTWYTGKNDGISADTIVLNKPMLSTYTANASLTAGLTGGLSGRVTDGTNGIAGVWVGINVASNLAYAYGTTTDLNGYFSIGGLVSGSYKVYFSGNNVGYLNIWHSDSLSPDSATPVVVTAPSYLSNINAVLTRAGSISGQVTDASVLGLANVSVTVSDAVTGTWLANAITDGNGGYTVSGLATGNYKVFFDGSSSGHGRMWYDTKADLASATVVAVTAGSTTPGINGVLPIGGSITGSVTASSVSLQGVSVTVYDAGTGIWITSTMTDSSGAYIINGLPTGSYKLQYFKSGHLTQWYNNQTSQAAASSVQVTAPGSTSLTTVILQAATVTVSGTIVTTSSALEGATVNIVGNPVLTTNSAANGSYSISSVPVNQDLQIMASKNGYVSAYSATLNSSGPNINARELLLFTSGEVSGGISLATGAIYGQTIISGLGTNLDGATVSIMSPAGKYTVLYDDGTGNYSTGRPTTSSNGRFFIPNIADGETVVLSATRTGWNQNGPKTYVVHANAVSQGNLAGTFATTTNVAQASGSNPSFYGDSITFTATISPTPTTGTVQFKINGTNLGAAVSVTNGSATSPAISDLAVATHTVTAVYSAGTGYSGSTSTGFLQTVNDRVKVEGSSASYLTLQAAIGDATNKIIYMRDTRFAEDVLVSLNGTFKMVGGLTSDFITPAANATSIRTLKIKNGKVIANRLVIKPD